MPGRHGKSSPEAQTEVSVAADSRRQGNGRPLATSDSAPNRRICPRRYAPSSQSPGAPSRRYTRWWRSAGKPVRACRKIVMGRDVRAGLLAPRRGIARRAGWRWLLRRRLRRGSRAAAASHLSASEVAARPFSHDRRKVDEAEGKLGLQPGDAPPRPCRRAGQLAHGNPGEPRIETFRQRVGTVGTSTWTSPRLERS